jgi:hypothetical protein
MSFKKNSFQFEEVWFDEELKDKPKVDIVHYIERSQPIQNIHFDEFHTILVDLTKARMNYGKI